MAHQDLIRVFVATAALGASLVGTLGCGASDSNVQTANVGRAEEGPALPYPDSPSAWEGFHSLRFALTVPLPDAATWKVDDHSRGELVGAQPRTHSGLVLMEETEPALVNHKGCEERAKARGLVPNRTLRTVEDTVTVGPEAFDTHVVVGVESRGPDGPLVGHVLAYGAYVRKCLFVHLSTEVPSTRDEATLSERLALARVHTLGGIKIDELGEVPREPHDRPH
ncbi:MAG TPA: hypothetical protein VGI39_43530 [Polyangiaceae bacterium]